MSVEPVTIVVTLSAPEFGADIDAMARTKAAAELGLDENQVMCISRDPATFVSETFSEPDGEGMQHKLSDASMEVTTTWAPAVLAHSKPPIVPVAWPDLKLGRGSRWHGEIPDPEDNSKAIEATLISDGEKLVLIDSPEGRGIMSDLRSHEWPPNGHLVGE